MKLSAQNSQEFAAKLREMKMPKEEQKKMLKELYSDLQSMCDQKVLIQKELETRQERYLGRHRQFSIDNKGRKADNMRELGDQ